VEREKLEMVVHRLRLQVDVLEDGFHLAGKSGCWFFFNFFRLYAFSLWKKLLVSTRHTGFQDEDFGQNVERRKFFCL
jgi:hypothetical protein